MQKPVNRYLKNDIDKLKDVNTDREYKNNIEQTLKLNVFTGSEDTDEMWTELKKSIKEVTNTNLGTMKGSCKL